MLDYFPFFFAHAAFRPQDILRLTAASTVRLARVPSAAKISGRESFENCQLLCCQSEVSFGASHLTLKISPF
jgi:hypothetical protein